MDKRTQRKLSCFKDIDAILVSFMDEPSMAAKLSMKRMQDTQKLRSQKLKTEIPEEDDNAQGYKNGKRKVNRKEPPKKVIIDSSDDEHEEQYEEKDDGKRDKIFSKFFLKSLSNQSRVKMAFIQQMGEDRLLKAELQTKIVKPSMFNTIHNMSSNPSSQQSQRTRKYNRSQMSQTNHNNSTKEDDASHITSGMNFNNSRTTVFDVIHKKLGMTQPLKSTQNFMAESFNSKIRSIVHGEKQVSIVEMSPPKNTESPQKIKLRSKNHPLTSAPTRNSTDQVPPSLPQSKVPNIIAQAFTAKLNQVTAFKSLEQDSASRNPQISGGVGEHEPHYLKTTTSFVNSSRQRKKVVVLENKLKEPSLKLFKDIKPEGAPVFNHQPSFYHVKKSNPKNPPANYQDVMKKQAMEDCKKPPLPFLSKTLNHLQDFYLHPNDEDMKEKAAYLMQKSRYHVFEPISKKKEQAVINKLATLESVISRRHIKTGLDIQELRTEFTNDLVNAWDGKPPLKVSIFSDK